MSSDEPPVAEPVSASPDAAEPVDLARAAFRSTASRAGAGGRTARWRPRRRSAPETGTGSSADDRDPQLLGPSVERLLTERGWETDVAVAGAVARWAQVVGADVAAHVSPQRYAEHVLHVLADSTAWATQMTYLAPTVVRRLNEALGDGTVQRLEVHGPTGPSWRRGALRVDGRGPRDTYG